MREISENSDGCIYTCSECWESFFISWKDNSCQCSGCLSGMCKECENKLKEKEEEDDY